MWTGEGFQTARRLFRERTETPQTKGRICFDCPHLLDFHGYLFHLALGGRLANWRPAIDSNQRYNYFWSRASGGGRAARAMNRREQAASLTPGGAGD